MRREEGGGRTTTTQDAGGRWRKMMLKALLAPLGLLLLTSWHVDGFLQTANVVRLRSTLPLSKSNLQQGGNVRHSKSRRVLLPAMTSPSPLTAPTETGTLEDKYWDWNGYKVIHPGLALLMGLRVVPLLTALDRFGIKPQGKNAAARRL
eukprot:753749-Hanusia_phi.AAC.2